MQPLPSHSSIQPKRRSILWGLGGLALGLALGRVLPGGRPSLAPGQELDALLGQGGRWIDLSHDFSSSTLYWPTASRFELTVEFHGKTEQGFHYEANRYAASEHGGTHIDAPAHFADGGKTVDQLAAADLVGQAVVIDVSAAAEQQPDYQVSVQDFLDWEKAQGGPIPAQAIVLLRTGYGKRWPDAKRYLGTDQRGPQAVRDLHFPGLHPQAALWLTQQRQIKAIGLDTASIDHGQSTQFESHRILFEKNIPALENLAHLDALPARGAFVVAAPMKIQGGSGAPLRVLAWVRQPS